MTSPTYCRYVSYIPPAIFITSSSWRRCCSHTARHIHHIILLTSLLFLCTLQHDLQILLEYALDFCLDVAHTEAHRVDALAREEFNENNSIGVIIQLG
jgi:hypothetical protein